MNNAKNTAALAMNNLTLWGSSEPFYLEAGETVLWISDNGDGTACVRVRTSDGWETTHDADIRPQD